MVVMFVFLLLFDFIFGDLLFCHVQYTAAAVAVCCTPDVPVTRVKRQLNFSNKSHFIKNELSRALARSFKLVQHRKIVRTKVRDSGE